MTITPHPQSWDLPPCLQADVEAAHARASFRSASRALARAICTINPESLLGAPKHGDIFKQADLEDLAESKVFSSSQMERLQRAGPGVCQVQCRRLPTHPTISIWLQLDQANWLDCECQKSSLVHTCSSVHMIGACSDLFACGQLTCDCSTMRFCST